MLHTERVGGKKKNSRNIPYSLQTEYEDIKPVITTKWISGRMKMETGNRLVKIFASKEKSQNYVSQSRGNLKTVISKKQIFSGSIQFTAGTAKVAIKATTGVEVFLQATPCCMIFFITTKF